MDRHAGGSRQTRRNGDEQPFVIHLVKNFPDNVIVPIDGKTPVLRLDRMTTPDIQAARLDLRRNGNPSSPMTLRSHKAKEGHSSKSDTVPDQDRKSLKRSRIVDQKRVALPVNDPRGTRDTRGEILHQGQPARDENGFGSRRPTMLGLCSWLGLLIFYILLPYVMYNIYILSAGPCYESRLFFNNSNSLWITSDVTDSVDSESAFSRVSRF